MLYVILEGFMTELKSLFKL